ADPRPERADAAAPDPLGERSALPDRSGRAVLRRAEEAREGRDVRPVSRREPRAVGAGPPPPSPGAAAHHPGLVRQAPGAARRLVACRTDPSSRSASGSAGALPSVGGVGGHFGAPDVVSPQAGLPVLLVAIVA